MDLSPTHPHRRTQAIRPRPFRLTAVALGCALLQGMVQAQVVLAPESDGMILRSSEELDERLPDATQVPVFLEGQRISGRSDHTSVVDGDAVLRKAGTTLRADHLEYDQTEDVVRARGKVRINRVGNVYEGAYLEIKVDSSAGYFLEPHYRFLKNEAHGEAARADFKDEQHAVVYQASYTTCKRLPGPSWVPDWILRASSIELNSADDEGIAHDAVLSFQGVPILPLPAISFPLSEKRKSGFLPPTVGLDNVNGVEVVVPYYWNIAPNRDATFTPSLMTSRGLDLGVEFRYLEPSYSGSVRTNYLPSDLLRNANRWAFSSVHDGVVETGLAGIGAIGVSANINRVSDDNYWKDFTRSSTGLTQRLLPVDLAANWVSGDFSTSLHALKWQTLQDPAAPILPPYDRLPQINTRFSRTQGGLAVSVEGDFTQFQRDNLVGLQTNAQKQPNAQRTVAAVQISYPWTAPEGFLVPKVQLHGSNYTFDDAAPADSSYANLRSANRYVPTFSLDSGLVLERDTVWFGKNLVQTLEPRAYYVYTPFKDQSALPNYDTAAADFNFASIYTENAFVGNDKISDNNLLTLGLTTRFLDADNGSQLARFGIAQRLRFSDQQVTLDSSTPSSPSGVSDILLGAEVNLDTRWALDSTVQYNPKSETSVRSTVGVRYSPGSYRVINAAYRYQRDLSEQIDLSWQWPLNNLWGDKGVDLGIGRGQGPGRYYSVARLNYSLNEGRLVDSIFGVEYDAGCWLGRLVLQRQQTSTNSATQSVMFQLEFVGFTRLGISPQRTLTQNISHYQELRARGSESSRFSNYD